MVLAKTSFAIYDFIVAEEKSLQQKLSELNREAEERETKKRAEKLGFKYVDPRKIPISLEAVSILEEERAKKALCAVIEKKANDVAVVFYNPKTKESEEVINELKNKNLEPKIFISSLSGIKEVWDYYKFVPKPQTEITGKVSLTKSALEKLADEFKNLNKLKAEFEKINFNSVSTTNLFQIILAGALATDSSDIHFEAQENKARIRFRIDGILYDIFDALPPRNYDGILSRIKLLSGLKINIHDEPQDGRFTINLTEKNIEVRVSIIPSEFGETVVMRILDPQSTIVGLNGLGIRIDDLEILEKNIKKPNGLILNTGPTGSGKTTTLYAILNKLNDPEIKIITIEDPIEYHLSGIEQTQVDPDVGYDFASGLRSIVRQDPDIILVGEIRDKETADIALQAALTGHLVLSTVHTNDSIGAIPRLIDLGVKPQIIGPALSLVIAQRLVRKLCEKCKKKRELSEDLIQKIKKFVNILPSRVNKKNYESISVYEPVGCEACSGLGYKGRIGIFEFFCAGPELEPIIFGEISWIKLKEFATKQGMVTMQQDGVLKVISGTTTFEEVESLTGPIEW